MDAFGWLICSLNWLFPLTFRWRNVSVRRWQGLSSRGGLGATSAKCIGFIRHQTAIRGRYPGRRRIYCSIGASARVLHVSIPKRQHVRPQRGTEAANDASTALRMTCVAANNDRWQPCFRYPDQTRPKSRIESTLRTLSARFPRFLDSSDPNHPLGACAKDATEDVTAWPPANLRLSRRL